MKTVINPVYAQLEAELLNVVAGNYTPEVVYCNKRNKVEKISIDGKDFVIKTFKIPHIINRVIYRFFRMSKACRAYEYALRLLESGVETPCPVAYFEKYRKGLFKQGVFISEYVPYKLLENLYEDVDSFDERESILSDFIDYLHYLHEKGIVPMDMNAGNIFYYKNESAGKYNFAITDINRIEFRTETSFDDVVRTLEQCFYPMDKMYSLVMLYSKKTGNEAVAFEIFHKVLTLRVKRRKKCAVRYKMRRKFLSGKKQR